MMKSSVLSRSVIQISCISFLLELQLLPFSPLTLCVVQNSICVGISFHTDIVSTVYLNLKFNTIFILGQKIVRMSINISIKIQINSFISNVYFSREGMSPPTKSVHDNFFIFSLAPYWIEHNLTLELLKAPFPHIFVLL